MIDRSMVTLIHADNFFSKKDIAELYSAVAFLNYQPADYGLEVPRFNLITTGVEKLFSKAIGEPIVIDKEKSGVFRKPMFGIHFEGFEQIDEWCFIIALEPTTFNVFQHTSGAENALQEYQFNYRDPFQWGDAIVNIELKANQGLFFRPWMFHSLDKGVIQYYRLLPARTTTANLEVVENSWKDISLTQFGLLALKRDGSLWTTINTGDTIKQVGHDNDWLSISGSMALKKDGSVWYIESYNKIQKYKKINAVYLKSTDCYGNTFLSMDKNKELFVNHTVNGIDPLTHEFSSYIIPREKDQYWLSALVMEVKEEDQDWLSALTINTYFPETFDLEQVICIDINGNVYRIISNKKEVRYKERICFQEKITAIDYSDFSYPIIALDENHQLWRYDKDGTITKITDGDSVLTYTVGRLYIIANKINGSTYVLPLSKEDSFFDLREVSALGVGVILHSIESPIRVKLPNIWFNKILTRYSATVAIDEKNNLWAWGDNTTHKLGLPLGETYTIPTMITDVPITEVCKDTSIPYRSIYAGLGNSIAVKYDGTIWGWGDNYHSQLLETEDKLVTKPIQLDIGNNWKYAVSSYGFTAALNMDSELYVWGTIGGNEKIDKITKLPGTYDKIDILPNFIAGITKTGKLAYLNLNKCVELDGNDWVDIFASYLILSREANNPYALFAVNSENKVYILPNKPDSGIYEILSCSNDKTPYKKITNNSDVIFLLRENGRLEVIDIDKELYEIKDISLSDIYMSGGGLYGLSKNGKLYQMEYQGKDKMLTDIISGEVFCELSASQTHAIAISSDKRKFWSWGSNSAGELGIGDTTVRLKPVTVTQD